MLPLRTAQASGGSWTQTEWITPTATLATAPSGTAQYFRPSSVSSFGQLVGTFGVCAGAGAWCQGPGEAAGGQTLRLAGNHKSDNANPYSSDLNGDGVSELLFGNWNTGSTVIFNGGWIYWGQGTPTSPSWSAGQRTDLFTNGAHGPLVADLNSDGYPEVIFAGFGGNEVSQLYWGIAGGLYGVQYNASQRIDLPTIAADAPSAVDLNRDGRPEVVFIGSTSYVYWGLAGGSYGVTYNNSDRTALQTVSGHGGAVVDLNGDGYPEVIIANVSTTDYIYIYWAQVGGTYGVTYGAARTIISNNTASYGDVTVADLNGDARPEIIAGNGDGRVYWGQAGGPHGVTYNAAASTALPSNDAQKISVADLNSDGHHDVVVQNYTGGFTRVFWGPLPGSGTATNHWTLSYPIRFRGLSPSFSN